MDDAALRRTIERAVAPTAPASWHHVGGTGWGDAWSLAIGDRRCFVKLATGAHADTLACEADGLRALASTRTLRVPEVAASGSQGATAYLAMEWLDLGGSPDAPALGRSLAALHRAATPHGPNGERFGWHRDNWIGGTPQRNRWNDDWGAFFRDSRLSPQFTRAFHNGFRTLERDANRLLATVHQALAGHTVVPSLVHGDLWSGNAGTLRDGTPVVFDPAVYVGDREVDLAMTELFGGFGAAFHAAYDASWRVDPGYAARRDLYNLYQLLNHLNLFGESYLPRTARTLSRVLREFDGV